MHTATTTITTTTATATATTTPERQTHYISQVFRAWSGLVSVLAWPMTSKTCVD